MKLRYQIFTAMLIVSGCCLIIYSYWHNDNTFWKTFDPGFVCIAFAFIVVATYIRSIIVSIPAWFLFALTINSSITSLFFDVTKYEFNQRIFGWVVASCFFIYGVIYNVFVYIIKKQVFKKNELCKKDARDKYKAIMERMNNMEIKLDHKAQQIDEFIKKLTHG